MISGFSLYDWLMGVGRGVLRWLIINSLVFQFEKRWLFWHYQSQAAGSKG